PRARHHVDGLRSGAKPASGRGHAAVPRRDAAVRSAAGRARPDGAPQPGTPAGTRLMPAEPLRIGVLGAARIAPMALVNPSRRVPGATVVAVAARDAGRARTFATRHGIARVHASYDALLADAEVEAVYNPLPNSLHAEWTVRALEAGKHV